ncbi:MAG TPA: hypothetical protein PLE92_12545, partial [Lentisphaeria bacterium]|nr:hypothetical protein [Lentisphaeria bacterium]
AVFADQLFIFSTRSEWTAHFLLEFVKAHVVDAPPPDDDEETILFEDVPSLPPPPAPAEKTWQGSLSDGTPLLLWKTSNNSVHLRLGDEFQVAMDLGHRNTVCLISESQKAAKRRRPQPGGYLLPILTYLLAVHDRYIVHAAGVVVKDKALLLMGESGSGKTTSALAFAAAGLPLLGDDLLVLHENQGNVWVHALHFKPKVCLAGTADKETLQLQNLPLARSAIAGAFIHLKGPPGQEETLTRLSPQNALAKVIAQSNVPGFQPKPLDWLRTLQNFCLCALAWEWRVGPLTILNRYTAETTLSPP